MTRSDVLTQLSRNEEGCLLIWYVFKLMFFSECLLWKLPALRSRSSTGHLCLLLEVSNMIQLLGVHYEVKRKSLLCRLSRLPSALLSVRCVLYDIVSATKQSFFEPVRTLWESKQWIYNLSCHYYRLRYAARLWLNACLLHVHFDHITQKLKTQAFRM
jgi:hypothetical protein